MNRILLIDTNISSWPIYEYLIGAGFDVYVVGGNPDDYLAKVAKKYINLDYSNINEMHQLIDSLGIELVVPGCNDRSYEVCSRLNVERNFKGIESCINTEILNNKEKFRHFASKNDIPVPALLSEKEALDYVPVIVKPVDSFSGRGITVVHQNRRDLLERAVTNAATHSRSGNCIVEKYVTGQLYSHSAFIVKQKIMQDFFVEEHCIVSPFAVDTSRVVSNLDSEVVSMLRGVVRLLADKLCLTDGLVHTQFIAQGKQGWIVEVTRRCPGDLYSKLIEFSTGFNYAEMYAGPFVGRELVIKQACQPEKHVVRHTITQPESGVFSSLAFQHELPLFRYYSLACSGDRIAASPFGRVGIFFTSSISAAHQDRIFRDLLARKLYVIQ